MGRLGVEVGQTVYDADGKRLGKVTRCDGWAFEVRRGLWSPRSWVVGYAEVLELGHGSVKIARSDSDLFELAAGELPHSWESGENGDATAGAARLPSAPGERRLSNTLARSAFGVDDGAPSD